MHYSVLVTGEDVEAQLDPFDENSNFIDEDITGEYDDQIKDRMKQQNETLEQACEYYGLEINDTHEQMIGSDAYEKVLVENGKIISATRCTNPQGEWDWYEIGGRWAGLIKLKSGNAVDSALIKDIDFVATEKSHQYGLSTYHLLHEEEWYSVDDTSKEEMTARITKLLAELPDDTRLTVVDIHC